MPLVVTRASKNQNKNTLLQDSQSLEILGEVRRLWDKNLEKNNTKNV